LRGDRDGSLVPHCHNWHSLSFYPDTILARGRSMSPFSQPAVDLRGRLHWIVEVIDSSNNFITSFGQYGNQDSGGRGAKVQKPQIPLAWPTDVAVSDSHAYVNDTIGMRVVRVKLACRHEETCDIVPAP